MKRRGICFLMLIAGTALAMIVLLWLRAAEPNYNGRSLAAWMSDLDRLNGSTAQKREARSAIASIGSNAIPTCLQFLGSKDSAVKFAFNRACAGLGMEPIFPSAKTKQLRALGALESLGPFANAAIPRLFPLLTNRDTELREAAFQTLRRMSEDAKPAIPALYALLTNRTQSIRLSAALAISEIDPRFGKVTGVDEILHRYDIEALNAYDTCELLLEAGRNPPWAYH